MRFLLLITFLYSFSLVACENSTNKNLIDERKDTIVQAKIEESLYKDKISWSDSSKIIYAVDTLLTHKGKEFHFDSAIAIDYTGFSGEHTYMPLNSNGQWISTIKRKEKLSVKQVQFIHSLFGNKKSFDNPIIIGCYEPRLGIVYFKDNKVIAQLALCLGCARLESTAKLGNGDNYSSINEQALKRLEKFCKDLQFSNCKN